MIVTEEEAKAKYCQESFGPGPDTWQTTPANRLCIGSACMAWRWRSDSLSDYPPDTKGFCGKAWPPL